MPDEQDIETPWGVFVEWANPRLKAMNEAGQPAMLLVKSEDIVGYKDEQWEAFSDEERVAAMQAEFANPYYFYKAMESPSVDVRAAAIEGLRQFDEVLVRGAAQHIIDGQSIDEHTLFSDVIAAINRARPEWNVTVKTEKAWLLRLLLAERRLPTAEVTVAYIRLAKEAFPELKALPVLVNEEDIEASSYQIQDDDDLPTLLSKLQRAYPDEPELQGDTIAIGIDKLGAFLERKARERRQAEAKRARRKLPDKLKQPTFYEARCLSTAVADGQTLRRWSDVRGEVALAHAVEGETVQTKLTAKPELNWWDTPTLTHDHLREHLRTLGPHGVLLLHITTAWALEDDRVTVTLDDLIKLIGWTPRRTAERAEQRRKVWRWLNIFNAMAVIGKRPGTYKDKLTKRQIDLVSHDPFIVFTGRRDEANQQMHFDHSQPPVEVSWAAGEWFKAVRNNPQVLSHFGNVLKLTGLPTGKPSGAWALSIGLALNQMWREGAARAHVHTAGDDNHLTARFAPFTRYELLDLLRSDLWVEDVLKSSDPRRAQTYWKAAIKLLMDGGVIGYYKELDPLPDARQGWSDFWLRRQRLDIRPQAAEAQDVAEIARRAQQVNKTHKKRGRRAARKETA